MIKKTILFLVVYLAVISLGVVWVFPLQYKLFGASWILLAPIAAGIITAIFRTEKKPGNSQPSGNPPRHTFFSFMEHWGTGTGIILLIVSARMLQFVFLPHMSGPSALPSNLHFIGLFFTLLFGSYFLVDFFAARKYRSELPGLADIWGGTIKKHLFKKKWNDTGKYLSSQKSAFLAFAVLGAGVLVTGAIKIAAFTWQLPSQAFLRVGIAHDIFGILFAVMLIVHILIVVISRSYRRLLYSWFTGQSPH